MCGSQVIAAVRRMDGRLHRLQSTAIHLLPRTPLPASESHASTLVVSYGYVDAGHPVLLQPRPLLLGIAPDHAAADAPFSALVERYVFTPAGMRKSARKHRDLPLREDLAQRLARPYRIDSSGAILRAPARPPQGDGAAGGVVSTVLDLARFDVALDQGALISAESRAEMMAPTRSISGEAFPSSGIRGGGGMLTPRCISRYQP